VRARCREWNCDDCCEEGEVSGLHQIDWGFFAGTMSGFATEVAAADGSLAEEVGGENARDVIATAAPLRPPTNKTHAVDDGRSCPTFPPLESTGFAAPAIPDWIAR
jgi:hypothetical protein